MKRSAPKRRTGLKSNTPLQTFTQLERRTPMPKGKGLKAGDKPLTQRKPIRQQSKKRRKENRERRQMANEMFPDGQPVCIVPWCGELADDLHEPLTRARGGSITDPDNGVPTCRGHNDEMTLEPAWAYELHLLVHAWDKRTTAQIAADRRRAIAEWVAKHQEAA